jgi:hypothetical protein
MQQSTRIPQTTTRSGAAYNTVGHYSAPKAKKFSPSKNNSTLDVFEISSGGKYSSVLVAESGLPLQSLRAKSPAFKVIEGAEMPHAGDIKWSPDRLEKLMKWPTYKPIRDKTSILPPHLRSNSPMTM